LLYFRHIENIDAAHRYQQYVANDAGMASPVPDGMTANKLMLTKFTQIILIPVGFLSVFLYLCALALSGQ
jgi:hypothetical protein